MNRATSLLLAILLATVLSGCQPPNPAVSRVTLDQGWILTGADTFTTGVPATVPGTVHTDLLAAGKIEDPFWRDAEMRLQWVGELDWSYRTTFQAGARMVEAEVVEMVFHGLDTYATVLLNGEKVLEADNMFRRWSVDITRQLRAGENQLEVRLKSPLPTGRVAREALGYPLPAGNDRGDPPTRIFDRKAAYHYGWDWGPRFVTAGIWRPVEVVAWRGARLKDIHLITDSISPEVALLTAHLDVEATRTEAERRAAGGAVPVKVSLSSPEQAFQEVSYEAVLEPGINRMALPLGIPHPTLWWPNGLGEPHLYTVQAVLEAGLRVDTLTTRVGIRSVELVTEPDSLGESFYFRVNGLPVFMKGANYVPMDHFTPRVTDQDYARLFRDVVAANMNMLRVWGGGIYEADRFYELADENGILIWQDFMFANGMYPGDSAFLANVREEAVDQTRRLRGHASLALWCGNNEMAEGWEGWGWARSYENPQDSAAVKDAYDTIFHEILPGVVAEEDPGRAYWPSSPSLGWGDPESLNRGDSHYWGVWHGREPFRIFAEKLPRFASEFGFQAFPPMATVEAFTDPADRSLVSPILLTHQKHPIGNELIRDYLGRHYPVPASFQDFVYLSQLLQARGMRVAFEAHRRAMPRTMGTLYWQLNDTWPVVSWSGVDYFGRWKALHYAAGEAFAPLLISPLLARDSVEVWGILDGRENRDGTLTLKLLELDGTPLWEMPLPTTLEANTSRRLWSISLPELLGEADPARVVLDVRFSSLSDTGEAGTQALLYLVPPRELALETPAIALEWGEEGGAKKLTLHSHVLAKGVYLATEPPAHFSRNFFDLLPGQDMTVRVESSLPLEELKAVLRIRTLAEVPREGLTPTAPPAGDPPFSFPGKGSGRRRE